MNVWNFTGNIGKDCEVASTQGGTTVCKFTVAVKSGFGDNQKTTWVNCRLWGKRAEGRLPEYLKKGQKVVISGECELAEWQGQDGSQNKALMVNVNDLELCGTGSQQGGYQQAPAPQQNQQAPQGNGGYQNNQQAPNGIDFNEDIPF